MAAGGLPAYLRPPDASDINIYLTIETVTNEQFKQQASEVDPFLMGKWIKQWFPGTEEARPIKGGKLLVTAKSEKIADNAIQNATDLFKKCGMKVMRMDSMNRAEGTIFARELLTTPIEEIIDNLKPAGVINVERIKTMQNGTALDNGVHVLTFEKKPLPANIIIGYMRYDVRQFYPRPLRCGGCCLLDHSRGKCPTKTEACRLCAKPRHEGACKSPKKCVNCQPPNDGHGSFDKSCPELVKRVAITKIKIDQDISYGQAKKQVEKQVACGEKSFAQTVKDSTQTEGKTITEEENSYSQQQQQNIQQTATLLDSTRQQRIEAEQILEQLEEENKLLQETLEKIRKMRLANEELRRQIAEEQRLLAAPDQGSIEMVNIEEQTSTTTTKTAKTATTTEGTNQSTPKGAINKTKRPTNNSTEPTPMVTEQSDTNRRARSNSSDEEVQTKLKAWSDETDRPQKEQHEYDIEPDLFSDLPSNLKKKLTSLIILRQQNNLAPAIFRRIGSEIIVREPYTRTEKARAEKLHDYITKKNKQVETPPPTPPPQK
jgi:hypothetical protein